MRHKNYFISLLFLLAALTASAQCPGPPNRTALINLQRANVVNGTRALQTVLTDTCGNQRYVTLDSLFVIIIDSIGNWYTRDDTTTDALRTAHILESAQWLGDAPDGYLLLQMGTLAGTDLFLSQSGATLEYFSLIGSNAINVTDAGIELLTTNTTTRAVNIVTDTVNTQGSVDPTNFRLNFLSDNSYLFADSLKVVGIGQFPSFPSLVGDGTDKGFFYYPDDDGISVLNGNGVNGTITRIRLENQRINIGQFNNNVSFAENALLFDVASEESRISMYVDRPSDVYDALSGVFKTDSDEEILAFKQAGGSGGDADVSMYLGDGYSGSEFDRYPSRAWGIQSILADGNFFDWIQILLPNTATDTTGNNLNFYNRAYYWRNEMPTGVAGDTLFHFWAEDGVNAGKNPGFMTLDQVCAHCAADAVNIYNTSDTTTDNTRIVQVLETLTFKSDLGELDGIFPFRFELTDAGIAAEPEMMVWRFPPPTDDSLTLAQSDQEIFFRSSTDLLFRVDGTLALWADSITISGVEATSSGDILSTSDVTTPGGQRTVKAIEGTFNADVLSWSAGSAGDRWDAVPANRSAIVVTAGSGTTSPALSVQDILVDGAGGGTISLDYTPAMPSAAYTTVRYIYNEGGDANVTVNTDQAWQFRDTTGDLGASFSLAAGANAKLVWIYDATPANARFFVILF